MNEGISGYRRAWSRSAANLKIVTMVPYHFIVKLKKRELARFNRMHLEIEYSAIAFIRDMAHLLHEPIFALRKCFSVY